MKPFALVVLLCLFVSACSGNSSPTSPTITPTPIPAAITDVSGTWTGSLAGGYALSVTLASDASGTWSGTVSGLSQGGTVKGAYVGGILGLVLTPSSGACPYTVTAMPADPTHLAGTLTEPCVPLFVQSLTLVKQ